MKCKFVQTTTTTFKYVFVYFFKKELDCYLGYGRFVTRVVRVEKGGGVVIWGDCIRGTYAHY